MRPSAAPLNPRQLTSYLSKARDLPELLALHREHREQFNYFHVGAFWSKFKILARGHLGGLSDRLAPVCEQTVLMLPELDARNLATLAHAFAQAGLVGTGPWQNVWTNLPEAIRRLIRGFDPRNFSNTVWAFAKAGHLSPELSHVISAEVMRRGLGDFNPQDLSNTAWALATAGHESSELFNAISAEAVRRRLGGYSAQSLSITAWAFATAGHASPELFNAISAEAVRRRLNGFNEQNLSNTAWAFATAGHESSELFNAISAEAVGRRLGGFKEQNLSITAWAFATAGHESPELFNAIAAEAVRRRLGGFKEQELCNTAWAFATAGLASPELFNAISAETVRRRLGGFKEQSLSNMAWAFATAGHEAPELFKAISAEAARRGLGGLTEQALSTIAWAFATSGHASPELFKAISAEAARRGLGGFNEQALSNTAWAFAVFDFPPADELFGTLSFTSRCAQFEESFSHKGLTQLHQWSLWREERDGRSTLWPGLSASLRQACRDAFIADEGKPSQLQSDVARAIRSRVAHVEEEHRCEASGYSIDALVTLNDGKRIAVEVDGPWHFVGRSHQPNGATLLKHRQLRHFGWRLESVPYWEWDRSKELHWLPNE